MEPKKFSMYVMGVFALLACLWFGITAKAQSNDRNREGASNAICKRYEQQTYQMQVSGNAPNERCVAGCLSTYDGNAGSQGGHAVVSYRFTGKACPKPPRVKVNPPAYPPRADNKK